MITRDLSWLAGHLNLPLRTLRKHMKECPVLGCDKGNIYGSPYTVDSQLLYALVRILQPARALEIGTLHGGSANAIAAALKANGGGHLVTIDIDPTVGRHIEAEYSSYVSFVIADANVYLDNIAPADFIHEDGAHSPHQVHYVYQNLSRLLNPGGLILSHDILEGVGEHIKYGIRAAGLDFPPVEVLELEGSPCGYTVYRQV